MKTIVPVVTAVMLALALMPANAVIGLAEERFTKNLRKSDRRRSALVRAD